MKGKDFKREGLDLFANSMSVLYSDNKKSDNPLGVVIIFVPVLHEMPDTVVTLLEI